MKKILISNDDGVYAPGLAALVAGVQSMAEVRVVAPDRDRSGASNSLTLSHPLRAKTLDNGFTSLEGTPTDCVHLALTGLFDDYQPDLILSGINRGSNLADDVMYSGTVAAAMEGSALGVPAMAFSMVSHHPKHYETGTRVVHELVTRWLRGGGLGSKLVNVNIPDRPWSEIQGYEITRLGRRHPSAPLLRENDPRGHQVYWVGPPGKAQDAGEGTDFHAIERGFISLTPLSLDFTHYTAFEALSEWAADLSTSELCDEAV